MGDQTDLAETDLAAIWIKACTEWIYDCHELSKSGARHREHVDSVERRRLKTLVQNDGARIFVLNNLTETTNVVRLHPRPRVVELHFAYHND